MSADDDLHAQFAADPWPVVGFLTTEHTTLTSMRAATVAEASARLTSFLGALSAALVAVGFVANASGGFGRPLHAFGAATSAIVAVIGVLTFARCVQSSIEDLRLLRRIERVRAVYLELAPGIAGRLAPPVTADADALRHAHGMQAGSWTQLLLTMAGLVGVVTSTAVAAGVGFVVRLVVEPAAAGWAAAAGAGCAALAAHLAFQMRTMRAALRPDLPPGRAHRRAGRREPVERVGPHHG